MRDDRALPQRILIPLANPRTAADLIRIGSALMAPGGVLTALSIVEVPEGMPLSEGATRARQARRLLQKVLEFAGDGVDLRTVVRIGRRAADGIAEMALEDATDLIILGWGGPAPSRRDTPDGALFSPTIDALAAAAPADIAVVKQRGMASVRRILVPVRGGPHAELALRFGARLGDAFDAQVEALHVVGAELDPTLHARAERALATFVRLHGGDRPQAVVRDASDVGAAIREAAGEVDLVVMGASVGGDPDGQPVGRLPDSVAQGAGPTVIVVRTREAPTAATFQQRVAHDDTLEAAEHAATTERSVASLVGRWFAESSFHHQEYADLRRLVELKEKQGLTISAVLPTLNEAATIGPIVHRARVELMEKVPLIDELLVIDSDSDDETRELAAAEGARVVRHPDVLAQYGSYRGKGEALWKSLYETSGDLIAWSDTDISDWHPRFLYGPLGPLLTEPRIGYVKAYYQRPIVQDGQMKEGGGGRVTELVARPLINMFFPELSGYIQPLAGEYAGRREHLERVPFFTGYAVEIGHLIDLLDRFGLNGFGQVDLDIRIHRNQELEGLSRMSFVILQAVMKRLEERRRAHLFSELGSTMKLPRSGPHELSLEVIELADTERPPMVRIPEYRARRGLDIDL